MEPRLSLQVAKIRHCQRLRCQKRRFWHKHIFCTTLVLPPKVLKDVAELLPKMLKYNVNPFKSPSIEEEPKGAVLQDFTEEAEITDQLPNQLHGLKQSKPR